MITSCFHGYCDTLSCPCSTECCPKEVKGLMIQHHFQGQFSVGHFLILKMHMDKHMGKSVKPWEKIWNISSIEFNVKMTKLSASLSSCESLLSSKVWICISNSSAKFFIHIYSYRPE